MFSELVFDEKMTNLYHDFLFDENQIIITLYPSYFKSFLMCKILGHEFYQLNEKDDDLKFSLTITYCVRCKCEILEKFPLNKAVIETISKNPVCEN